MASTRTETVLDEMRDITLWYLMLAQRLIQSHREEALALLGISDEAADKILALSRAQFTDVSDGDAGPCPLKMNEQCVWKLHAEFAKADRGQ